jgi:CheY-like chemotaxis protein
LANDVQIQFMKVLFIDDDIDDREFFIDALSYVDASIKCTLAKNCEHALSILAEFSEQELPQYVFLDIHMPAMDGRGCLKKIKSDPKYSAIKVVMYSGTSDPELMKEYKDLGATYFLVKPLTFNELCDSLAVLFDRH